MKLNGGVRKGGAKSHRCHSLPPPPGGSGGVTFRAQRLGCGDKGTAEAATAVVHIFANVGPAARR